MTTSNMRHVIPLAILLLAGCADPPATAAKPVPTPIAITTVAASVVDHAAVEQLPGTVRAATAATLQARVPGVVASIQAEPGALVAAGAVLVELDAQELAARRDQARAGAAQTAADFARASQLFASQAITKAEFDAAQARAAGSAAQAAEAAIMLGYTRITAPFAGVVVRRLAEVGDLVGPGRALVALEDPASLRLEVEVPESLAGGLKLGDRLHARIDAAGLDRDVAVVEITPAADPVTRSVLMKLGLGAASGLRSGQFGRAAVATAGSRMLAVPAAAVVHRGQLDALFVIDHGAAHLRLVRLGGPAGDGLIAVRAGLLAGETVAISEVAALTDGSPVTVR